MKEDKLDKEIAASLKKKLVEASMPYELGAWEGFQKKRAMLRRRTIAYWASGIAASLLLIAVGLNSVDLSVHENADSTELKLAESEKNIPEKVIEELPESADALGTKSQEEEVELESSKDILDLETLAEASTAQNSQANPADKKAIASSQQPIERSVKLDKVELSSEDPANSNEKAEVQIGEKSITQQEQQIAKAEEASETVENQEQVKAAGETGLALAKAEVVQKTTEPEIFVAENDFPIIPKEKASVGLGMGLSPGFGAIQSDNQVATAQTIGLGMLVDINLPGKFTLGSGVGLNYLNQNAEQESMVTVFGNSYPQTEKLEVQQMQVEVPVFVKYPVTRNNSVSIQAGFSNYYALNQKASQENITERQVAVYNNDAAGFSSLTMRQESVVESKALESKSGKFYPFATLNFGVNLRVLETKGANYVIMPFYNYQLKQVSGYGDTYGLFGASFKMNFGGGDR
ncbi:hypothetical protein [Algoriphagus chordae]|uniref:Outer membrane protein with beta-barrel domain n=1 Tax=Algoriphagus chordae TaxID=237019 RepID=A0A2W7QW18_9BACT|nr:hypothetical protein [Algoriphagus chordae]PZX51376.1 hypothetical protein LV85_02320 [Algoriphagus chordae]